MNQIVALQARPGRVGFAVPMPRRATDRVQGPVSLETRPLAACGAIRAEWADLAAHALQPNPFFEPDVLLAAAQHLIAFRDMAVLLVWRGAADEPGRHLIGLMPCLPRHGMFAPETPTGLADPRIADGTPLVDARHGLAALSAILSSHAFAVAEHGLVLRQIELDGPLAQVLMQVADAHGMATTLRTLAPAAPSGTAAAAAPADKRLVLREAATIPAIRDAVEILLALEASGAAGRAGTAALQDTREASFLRAMTRGLARARQCRVAMLMDGEEVCAAALLIGRGRRRYLYASAQDEARLELAPRATLLAALARQGRGHLPLNLQPDWLLHRGEIRLVPQTPLRPRDLAQRARAALMRMIRPRRAAAGG